MPILTVTARRQVTLSKEILRHLGVEPGEGIEVNLLSGGRVELKAARTKDSFRELRGFLKGKTNNTRLSIREINKAITLAGHRDTKE